MKFSFPIRARTRAGIYAQKPGRLTARKQSKFRVDFFLLVSHLELLVPGDLVIKKSCLGERN
jgi:hypothetical protein